MNAYSVHYNLLYRKGKWVFRLNYEDRTAWIIKGHIGNKKVFTLPEKVKYGAEIFDIQYVELYAFTNEKFVEEIHFPDSYIYIDEDGFVNCKNLRRIYLGGGIRYYHYWSFKKCPLEQIAIDAANPYLKMSDDGKCILSKDGTELVCMPLDACSITVPDTVTELAVCSFTYTSLSKIRLPASLRKIGSNAFMGNSCLLELHIPEGVHDCGIQTYYGNENLQVLDLPSTLKTLEWEAIDGCSSLKCLILRCGNVVETEELGDDVPFATCTLCVPENLLNKYKMHPQWGKFKEMAAL